MIEQISRRENWMVALVGLVGLIQGLLYIYALPPWQHYDEPTHFEYAWLLANREGLPSRRAGFEEPALQREVAATMLESNFYWNLPKPDLLRNDRPVGIGFSELDHPPTYYLLVSLPLRFLSHLDPVSQLYVARLVSLLLFLLTLGCAAGILRELTPAQHPLRWAVPLAMALSPPFVDIMTAVNNDVGAALAFTLFLWGCVRLIRRVTPFALLWVVAAAGLAVLMKSTTFVALPLVSLAIVLAFWVQVGWRWRWLVLAAAVLPLAALLLLRWDDAAYWYHWEQWGSLPIVESATRRVSADAPVGSHVVALTVEPERRNRRLMNPILSAQTADLAGRTVTVGAWVWASRPVELVGPGLVWGRLGTQELQTVERVMQADETPRFVAWSVQLPAEVGILYYTLFGKAQQRNVPPFELYVDGAVLVEGDWTAAGVPLFGDEWAAAGVWGEQPFVNLVRNGSGEASWPRVGAPLERPMQRALSRSPTALLNGLWDTQRTGRLVTVIVPQELLVSTFARVAWGHVGLPATPWRWIFALFLLAALVGGMRWLFGLPPGRRGRQLAPVLLLAAAGILICANTLLWPISWMWGAKVLIPAGRYLSPAAFVIALLLMGGWWALGAPGSRRISLAVALIGLGLLNLLMLATIAQFYQSIAL